MEITDKINVVNEQTSVSTLGEEQFNHKGILEWKNQERKVAASEGFSSVPRNIEDGARNCEPR